MTFEKCRVSRNSGICLHQSNQETAGTGGGREGLQSWIWRWAQLRSNFWPEGLGGGDVGLQSRIWRWAQLQWNFWSRGWEWLRSRIWSTTAVSTPPPRIRSWAVEANTKLHYQEICVLRRNLRAWNSSKSTWVTLSLEYLFRDFQIRKL